MYPLAHLYFARKALSFADDALLLGSIYPDMAIISGIDWEESHRLGFKLWQHFCRKGRPLAYFSLGVISHGVEPPGLDYYSDEKYGSFEKGYCFEKARPLIDDVIKACFISAGDGWWKAHNFIEMGIELYLFDKFPHLLTLLKRTLNNDGLIKIISRELSYLLGKEESLLEKSFLTFRRFVAGEKLDARLLAQRYQRQIYYRHNIASIDLNSCSDIILEGKKLVAPDIQDFFNDVKRLMLPTWQRIQEMSGCYFGTI